MPPQDLLFHELSQINLKLGKGKHNAFLNSEDSWDIEEYL